MKKIINIVLVLILVSTLSGCSDYDLTKYQSYDLKDVIVKGKRIVKDDEDWKKYDQLIDDISYRLEYDTFWSGEPLQMKYTLVMKFPDEQEGYHTEKGAVNVGMKNGKIVAMFEQESENKYIHKTKIIKKVYIEDDMMYVDITKNDEITRKSYFFDSGVGVSLLKNFGLIEYNRKAVCYTDCEFYLYNDVITAARTPRPLKTEIGDDYEKIIPALNH